jgi:uncharacterized peroxidase-related enzyme
MSTETFKIDLPLRTADDSDATVASLLQGHKKAMGMVPNMYAAMVNFPALLETYSFGYERFRKESGLTLAEQEVVFLTISRANSCTYCVAAHSMLADTMSKVPAAVTEAIRTDTVAPDDRLEALRRFTEIMVRSAGNPTTAQADAFLAAGFAKEQILAIILALGVKVFSNFSNHIFHTEVDPAFAGRAWQDPKTAG